MEVESFQEPGVKSGLHHLSVEEVLKQQDSWSWLLSKLGHWGEKILIQGGDQEPNGHTVRAPEFLRRERRTFQKHNHLLNNSPIRPVWQSSQMEATMKGRGV